MPDWVGILLEQLCRRCILRLGLDTNSSCCVQDTSECLCYDVFEVLGHRVGNGDDESWSEGRNTVGLLENDLLLNFHLSRGRGFFTNVVLAMVSALPYGVDGGLIFFLLWWQGGSRCTRLTFW